MAEEQVDVEYITLHRYIRNTPSDTECMQSPCLEQRGVPDQQKRIYRPTQNSRSGPELQEWEHCTKTLEYQRTNPKGYQLVRTYTKETTVIQDQGSPNHPQQPVQDASSKQQSKNKNSIISRHDYHLTQLCPSEEKQTKKEKLSEQTSPYKKLTHTTGPNLEGRNQKEEIIQP